MNAAVHNARSFWIVQVGTRLAGPIPGAPWLFAERGDADDYCDQLQREGHTRAVVKAFGALRTEYVKDGKARSLVVPPVVFPEPEALALATIAGTDEEPELPAPPRALTNGTTAQPAGDALTETAG